MNHQLVIHYGPRALGTLTWMDYWAYCMTTAILWNQLFPLARSESNGEGNKGIIVSVFWWDLRIMG